MQLIWGSHRGSRMISRHRTTEPPACITGADISRIIDTSQSGRFCSVDWIRLTGPPETQNLARSIADSTFGTHEDQGHGFGKYGRHSINPDSGSIFLQNNISGDSWQLELSGSACQWKGTPGLIELLKTMRTKARSTLTRLDLAVDLFGNVEHSIDHLTESVQNGLVSPGNRQCDPRCTTSGNRITSHGLYVGSRNSRWMLRLYDKGLETKSRPKGEWVRWELECHQETADSAAQLLEAVPTSAQISSLAAGFFTCVNGPGRDLWLRLSEDTTTVSPPKKKRSGAGFLEYQVGRNTAPTICEAARRVGIDPYDFARALNMFDCPEVRRSPEREGVVRDLVLMYAEHMESPDV